ncbi:MAG: hypothetical protein U5K00_19060 [Melioribacteraceae bacterium]|nr:hypothetical protein [Melioribacteraceae bacterium]
MIRKNMKLFFILSLIFTLSLQNVFGQLSKETEAVISNIQSSSKIAPLLEVCRSGVSAESTKQFQFNG